MGDMALCIICGDTKSKKEILDCVKCKKTFCNDPMCGGEPSNYEEETFCPNILDCLFRWPCSGTRKDTAPEPTKITVWCKKCCDAKNPVKGKTGTEANQEDCYENIVASKKKKGWFTGNRPSF